MSSATFVMLSGVLTFGVPLLLALRELFFLRPSPRGGDGPPPPPVLTPQPRPLPDCLLPHPVGFHKHRQLSILEDA